VTPARFDRRKRYGVTMNRHKYFIYRQLPENFLHPAPNIPASRLSVWKIEPVDWPCNLAIRPLQPRHTDHLSALSYRDLQELIAERMPLELQSAPSANCPALPRSF
jgi:hypothetical protein